MGGLSLRIHRMQFANAEYCVVKRSDPYVVSLSMDGAEDIFALLRILSRVKVCLWGLEAVCVCVL